MKREKEFKEIAVKINTLRVSNVGKEFCVSELKHLLKGVLPCDCTALVEMVNTSIIVRTRRGVYCFPSDPVRWEFIRNFYKNCRDKRQNYRESKSVSNADLKKMIEIIKANGYVVFRKM